MAAEPGGGRARPLRCCRPPLAALTALTAGLLLLLLPLPPSASSSSSCDHRVPSGEQVGRPGVLRRLRGVLWGGGSVVARSRCWIRPFWASPGRAVPAPAPPPRLWALRAAVREGSGRAGRGWHRAVLPGQKGPRARGRGCCVSPGEPSLPAPVPAPPASPRQVIYRVPLKENHVSKRNVDQQLRIKIVYDRSVEE